MKWFCYFFSFLAAILIGFFGYLFVYRANFLSNILTQTLQTPVRIEEIIITKTGIEFTKFTIHNPPGCQIKKALSAASIAVTFDWLDFILCCARSDTTTTPIKEIAVQAPYVSLELFNFNGSDNNWKRMLAHMTDDEQQPVSHTFTVDKLIFTHITVEMLNKSVSKTPSKLTLIQKIEKCDLGNEEAVSLREINYTAFELLLSEIATELRMKSITQGIKHLPHAITQKVLIAPKAVSKSIIERCVQLQQALLNLFKQKQQP